MLYDDNGGFPNLQMEQNPISIVEHFIVSISHSHAVKVRLQKENLLLFFVWHNTS